MAQILLIRFDILTTLLLANLQNSAKKYAKLDPTEIEIETKFDLLFQYCNLFMNI